MLKKLLNLLFAVPVFLAGCSDENKKSAAANKEVYSVATSADYPPFEYLQDGKIVGFDIDLIQAVATKMGIKIQINDMSFDGILGSLASNRTDMAISSITPTEERRKAVDFSDEYYSTTSVLVCSNAAPVHNATDLTGKAIGVQAGSIHETFANGGLKEKIPDLTAKSLPRIPELVQELKTGRVSCILMGETEANGLIKSAEGLRLVGIDSTSQPKGCAIAVPQGSSLREKINQALVDLKADGTIEKLKQKWLQK